uniref:Uncharacterized protein n=1 Tax=Solenopsis invicta TaxID=13686 RepID=D3KD05_SOLIN|nr:hypothetical protein [Solenopsis invicta]
MSSVSSLLGDQITFFFKKACSSRECTSKSLGARTDELYSTFIACPMKRSAVYLLSVVIIVTLIYAPLVRGLQHCVFCSRLILSAGLH